MFNEHLREFIKSSLKDRLSMELQTRIAEIEKILKENAPKKDKIIKSYEALSGLNLTSLDLATQNKLKQNLVAGNKVLSQYPILTFDDYKLISEIDMDRLLTLMKKNYKCLRKFIENIKST